MDENPAWEGVMERNTFLMEFPVILVALIGRQKSEIP
jgi:hypothetical protein